jgi:hypothetical protein
MRKFAPIFMSFVAALLASCGGSGDAAFQPAAAGGTTQPVASVAISVSQATIANDGTGSTAVTAFVRDSGNRLLSGVTVTFTADSGALEVRTATTGTDGQALAILTTPGNSTLRTINVTASASSGSANFNASTTVQVVAPQSATQVGSLTIISSTPTLPSNSALDADITAFVRDASNRFMAGIPVTFTSTSGGLTVVTGTSTAAGQATAKINAAGDPTNRSITVTATAQTINASVTISVTGSRLTLQGPAAMVLNQKATFQISLTDSGDRGIPNRAITIASARGNTLSANSVVTDTQGRATVDVTIANSGNDTLTVTGLGLTATQSIAVNSDSFAISTPAVEGFEIPLSTAQTVTLHWTQGGAPRVGQTVTFSSTRGTTSAPSAVTDANGDATITVSSTNAGVGLVTATSGTATATRTVEFVATTAATIDIQASVSTIAPNEQTTLTAVVRDPANNLVKNKTVTFSLIDTTGGTISTASAVTNSQGRAQTVYTAGSTTSATDGVKVTASVQGSAGTISKQVSLTVARLAVFITLGTGNSIEEPSISQYKVQYAIQVTDATGNGVPNVPLTVSATPQLYYKGSRVFLNSSWANRNTAGNALYTCANEDANHNGQLDAGEDFNGNGRLDPGGGVIVSAAATTNSTGFALIDVLYPQDYAYWMSVTLEARAQVSGTEYSKPVTFELSGLASDFNQQSVAPPGPTSPWGVNVCTIPN